MYSLRTVTALALVVFTFLRGYGATPRQVAGKLNFDVRTDQAPSSEEVRASYRSALPAWAAAGLQESMARAKAQLAVQVPGLNVELNAVTRSPEIVDAAMSGAALTAPSRQPRETVVRSFLAQNALVFGITAEQVAQLRVTADYSNPAGNLSWLELEQVINGIPVFQGRVRAAVRADGAVARTTGNLAAGLNYAALPSAARLTPQQAVAAAAASINVEIIPEGLPAAAVLGSGRKHIFPAGPFDRPTHVDLAYFSVEPGLATLAYSMVLWEAIDAYYILVDAQTGELLWRKNITNDQTQTATFGVYNDDSPVPMSPTTSAPGLGIQGAAIPRTTFTLISEGTAFNNTGWIPDGVNTTTGNNVDAGLDIDGTNGIDTMGRPVGTPNRVFDYNYIPGGHPNAQAPTLAAYRSGVVTNMFFWSNRYHDRLYDLGFTEAAGNFQQNNFGRGGGGNDRVLAEAQDASGTNNANFATPPDGQSGRMQMFIFDQPSPDRDSGLDQEIVIHELTHGLSNRLHGNGSGLATVQSGGMGEGWSDFYARALLSTQDEDVNGVYASGGYSTLNFFGVGNDNYYYGIRRFPYAVKSSIGSNGRPHNPLTFADIDPGQLFATDGAFPKSPIGGNTALQVHAIGEIWCSALLEVRARIITRMGFTAGNQRMLQLTTDAMKLDPANPTLLQGRNSLIAASQASFGGADVADIWAGFAAIGMGFNASTNGNNVVESFLTPNLVLGAVTVSDAAGNNSGFPDPGERVTLTVPLRNLLTTPAIAASATVGVGGAVNYDTIEPGATVTREIIFTVPSTVPPGTRLDVPIVIASSLGSVGPAPVTFPLVVGMPMNGFVENFDALPGSALPTGWTTARTGSGTTWIASTTNPDTAPRNLYSPNAAASGTAEVITPNIAINSASAQLTFRNSYNLETSSGEFWDGMVLEMSVDNGPYRDVVEAGAIFLAGGYNISISLFDTNPLAGRGGWGGLSGGTTSAPAYITTSLLLPASVKGKHVRFKWILGCDSSVAAAGAAGVRIDSITVSTDSTATSANQPPVISNQTLFVAAGSVSGATVGAIAASDPDDGQTLTFTITSGNPVGIFQLDELSGVLTVANSPLLQIGSAYSLAVRVSDNGSPQPLSSSAIITVEVTGGGASAPVVVTSSGSVNYVVGQAATAIDPGLVVSDSDSANLVSARVAISNNFSAGQDVLAFGSAGAIAGTYDTRSCPKSLHSKYVSE